MTREEKQKAIGALKISVPIKALTQEEFNDYIQALNKVMDWLEQEPVLDKIRDEIKQTSSRYVMSRERGYEGQVEWSDRLIKENEVLEIIDKYNGENNS